LSCLAKTKRQMLTKSHRLAISVKHTRANFQTWIRWS